MRVYVAGAYWTDGLLCYGPTLCLKKAAGYIEQHPCYNLSTNLQL